MSVSPIPRLLTVADVARLAQVSEWTVRKEIKAERIRVRRVRGCWRVTESEYTAWIERYEAAS